MGIFQKNKAVVKDIRIQDAKKTDDDQLKALEASLDFLKEADSAQKSRQTEKQAVDAGKRAADAERKAVDAEKHTADAERKAANAGKQTPGIEKQASKVDSIKQANELQHNSKKEEQKDIAPNETGALDTKNNDKAHTTSENKTLSSEQRKILETAAKLERNKQNDGDLTRRIYGRRMDYKTAKVTAPGPGEKTTVPKTTVPKTTPVQQLKNPLPVPKKHVPKELKFDIEPDHEQMHFDMVDLRGKDFFDIN